MCEDEYMCVWNPAVVQMGELMCEYLRQEGRKREIEIEIETGRVREW